jgi:hypothetical protein
VGALQRTRFSEEANGDQFALVTEDDLYVGEAIRRVRVTFEKPTSENLEEVERLFAYGGIDQKTLCAEIARRNGFDPSQMCTNEKEMSMEERKFLIPELAAYAQFKQQADLAEQQMSMEKDKFAQEKKVHQDEVKQKAKETKAAAETAASGGDAGGGVDIQVKSSGGGGATETQKIMVRPHERSIQKKRKAEESGTASTKKK